MKDYVTGIDFNSLAFQSDALKNAFTDANAWAYRSTFDAMNIASAAPTGRPSLYTQLRAQRRHLFDGKEYRPASTHAEALEKFGFRVTSGGGR